MPRKAGLPPYLPPASTYSELENGVLRDLYLPPEAEYLNAAYMQELVAQQTILKPGMWERKR